MFIKIPDKARGECCCREPQCCAILCRWVRGVAWKTLQAALISFSFRLCAAQQWPHCPACRAASIFELQGDDEVWFNDQCSTPCCMFGTLLVYLNVFDSLICTEIIQGTVTLIHPSSEKQSILFGQDTLRLLLESDQQRFLQFR